jgi:repressor LexA
MNEKRDVLASIRRSIAKRGYPPTLKEMADEFGVTPPTIWLDLQRLEQEGYITRVPHSPRSITLTEKGTAT